MRERRPGRHPAWPARVSPLLHSWGPALVAAALAGLAWSVGVRGTDQAAQAFRVLQVRQHGLSLLEPGWYGGVYPLSYSVAFPPLAAVVTLAALGVATAALAAWAFDRLTTAYLGARSPGSWYFAVSSLLQVAIGQLPFLAGEALGLCALLALSHRRRLAGLVLGVAAALCSPLAAAFLALACVAWRWAARDTGWWPLGLAVVSMGLVGAVELAFPGAGYFPFPWTELVVIELLCLLVAVPLVRTTPAVRVAAALYAVSSLVSFLVPNPLGGNAGRLAGTVGIPLLACFAGAASPAHHRLSAPAWVRRLPRLAGRSQPRRVAALALLPFAVWQWSPGVSALAAGSATSPSTTAAFYQPLLRQLRARPGDPQRVEVVPTADHWEAAYVAPSIPLARGWERQVDTARNPIFYRPGLLTPASYRRWLLADGVTWVALPDAPLDYAGKAEGALLRSGRVPGLERVWRSATWTLWRVAGSPGLTSGPARVTYLAPDRAVLRVAAAGSIILRLRWSGYWAMSPAGGCLAPTGDGWTRIEATAPGTIQLSAGLGPGRGPFCPGAPPAA